jgi:AraC-like DNA-binding protein
VDGTVDWTPGYREFAPPAWLRGTLSCLWTRVALPTRAQHTLVLPHGASDLIWQSEVGAFLAGPNTGPAPAVAPAGSVFVGARFRPGAGGTVLGLPLAEVLDERPAAGELPALRGRIPPAGLPPHRALPALVRLVADLSRERPADPVATQAARLLGRPGVRVEDVAVTLELSERQLLRRCQAGVGYGPQMLQRILRFRRFVSAVDAGPLPPGGLADAAIAAGYADQPHLSRDCVRLSGLTPRALAQARR